MHTHTAGHRAGAVDKDQRSARLVQAPLCSRAPTNAMPHTQGKARYEIADYEQSLGPHALLPGCKLLLDHKL